MKFHIGMDVWIGWHPDEHCGAPWARCALGTITGGPFPAGRVKNSDSPTGYFVMGVHWHVKPQEGEEITAGEEILFPFSPPDREVDIEQCLEYTE